MATKSDETHPQVGPRHHRLVTALVVVTTVLAFVAIFSLWINRQSLNTDNWTTTSGKLLEIWSTTLIGPAFFYVDNEDIVYIPEHNGGLVSVLTLDGERLAQWGDPSFRSCHGIWGDSHGDIYVVRPGAWGRPRRIVKYVRRR